MVHPIYVILFYRTLVAPSLIVVYLYYPVHLGGAIMIMMMIIMPRDVTSESMFLRVWAVK
jgi:hypothetical protein